MDIWAWVRSTRRQLKEAGNHRLAELIDQLPTAVCDNEHERADAIYPEALALARQAKNPWVELFVRHWNLQSRILHRHEVGEWTGEAVSLLEFAHRPETKECPQSVCVTQDVVNCYGNVDGPGFAPERLEVTAETLARIDPRWPCFVCISAERADALLDAGRPADALAFVEAQTRAMVAAGVRRAQEALGEDRAMALLALGRAEEALTVLDGLGAPMDRNDEIERAISRARTLVGLQQHGEAFAALPEWEAVEPTPGLYRAWSEVVVALARVGRLANDWQLDTRLEVMTTRLIDQGVRRNAIDLLCDRADLALRRQMPHVARECIERAEALVPDLHRELDVRGELVALRGRLNVADVVPVTLPATADEVFSLLGTDPEANLPVLEAARRHWPDSKFLLNNYVKALNVRARHASARALLESWLAAHDDAEMTAALGQTLLESGDHAGLRTLCEDALARQPGPDLTAQCHWLMARSFKDSHPARCRVHLEHVVAIKPEATHCQTWLAELERQAGDWEQALERLNGVITREPEAGTYDWDRLVVATHLERWPEARESARRIGYDLPEDGEGPIVLRGILCRIRFTSADGDEQTLFARRTGPVTADIVQMRPEHPCRYQDEVIFDASPLNPPPQEGEENHTWIYQAIHIQRPGGYTIHAIDGVHPGPAALQALRDALDEDLDCHTQIFSGEAYKLRDPDSGEALQGLYLMLAVPETADRIAVDARLAELTADYAHPLTWTTLAEAAGNTERVEAHRALVERYGM
ncbi:MAG: hypothetical protein R3F60_06730 [bacterium]